MTLAEFVRDVRAGTIPAGAGGETAEGALVDGVSSLAASDLDAITAEAFNQDVFPAGTTWATGRRQVEEAWA